MAAVIMLYLLITTLSSPLLLGQLQAVEAGDRLIATACHTADVPSVCLQCVKSDEHAANADAVGIAGIILNCLMGHSDNLAGNMSALSTNLPSQSATKRAYDNCGQYCSNAKKALKSAAGELKKGKYDGSELWLREAALYQSGCRYELGRVNDSSYVVPANVYYDLNVFDILTVAAFRIIERL